MSEKKEKKTTTKTIKHAYQRWIEGKKVVVKAESLREAEELFKKLQK